ncbi:transmembrane protein [Perilla frutescens var. hirtella]|nr:transmembrane protein [Perilla frutescens var. hirtella]
MLTSTGIKKTDILILFLLASSVMFASEARRLNAVSSPDAAKEGPSPGEGHKAVNAYTLAGVKESGPSPGEGHKYTNTKPLGRIKDSGPSPGAGH